MWIAFGCKLHIFVELHWIEWLSFGLHWMWVAFDLKLYVLVDLRWIGLETRRGIVGEIRSRAEFRTSQMPTTAGRQFFFGSVQKLGL